jgi:hypothetical protein
MKSVNKLLRIVAAATIVSLLVVAVPASPALAAERLDLEPEKGEIGDRIDVEGSGFKRSTEARDYRVYIFFSREEAIVDEDYIDDLNSYAKVKEKSTDAQGEIDTYFHVPAKLRDGDVDEDVYGGIYYVYTAYSRTGVIKSKDEFRVIAAAIELDPDKGAVGTEIEIAGKDFVYQEYITVEYDGVEVNIESGDRESGKYGDFTSTIVIPKSTVGKHTITVTDKSGSKAEAEFTVREEITVTPTKGTPGDKITVKGAGFAKEVDVTIKFAGDEVVTGKTDDYGSFQVTFPLPVKSPGSYDIEARDKDNNKDTVVFSIAAGINLSPKTGAVGTEVTISGTGFTPAAMVTITYATEPVIVATTIAHANGKFSATFTVPKSKHGEHTITATDGANVVTTTFTMESTRPPVPVPRLPLLGGKVKSQAHFEWDKVSDPSGVIYTLQIATDEDFTSPSIVLEKTELAEPEYSLTKEERLRSVEKEAPYYWRVRAVDRADNESDWTTPGSFYVGFTFELTGWILYTSMGIAGLLLLFISYLVGYSVGKRTA